MATMYLDLGEITCPDAADVLGVNVGDLEWRLLDHPENPGYSADFASRDAALAWAVKADHAVVEIWKGRGL